MGEEKERGRRKEKRGRHGASGDGNAAARAVEKENEGEKTKRREREGKSGKRDSCRVDWVAEINVARLIGATEVCVACFRVRVPAAWSPRCSTFRPGSNMTASTLSRLKTKFFVNPNICLGSK